jgi:hypothetical protein
MGVPPEEIRTNAYRVLGAPASAHIDEVHRCAESMMRAAKLGLATTYALDVPRLGDVPRSESVEADVRVPRDALNDLHWDLQAQQQRDGDVTHVMEAHPTRHRARVAFAADPLLIGSRLRPLEGYFET